MVLTGTGTGARGGAGPGSAVAVIVSYESRQHLSYSLPSLGSTEGAASLRILVVDNGSTDGTREYVHNWFPGVEVLRVWPNRGFTGGANAGLRHALRLGATVVALFNADILIHPSWLRAATLLLRSTPKVGIVGFAQVGGLRSVEPPRGWPELQGHVRARRRNTVSGACLCFSPAALREVGLFDTGFRTFAEETDLYLRFRRAGYHVVELSVPSWHFNGGYWSRHSLRGSYQLMRSLQRFGIKHWPVREWPVRAARLVTLCCSSTVKVDPSYQFHALLHSQRPWVRRLIFCLAALSNGVSLPATLIQRAAVTAPARSVGLKVRGAPGG